MNAANNIEHKKNEVIISIPGEYPDESEGEDELSEPESNDNSGSEDGDENK